MDCLLYLDYNITNCLSKGKHTTIISLDFEKAFDKIGIHFIVSQLKEREVGPCIISYIVNFMVNRKFSVRLRNNYSPLFPIHNGIPHCSPISMILFLIAYNKLCSIIELYKEIDFTAYADDFNFIINSSRGKNPSINLDNLFNSINQWSDSSGAILSMSKCKYIHICRKKIVSVLLPPVTPGSWKSMH